MAHYAEDCWDAEVQTSYGWIECAGLADRSAYDLTAHATATKADLTVFEKFEETQVVEALTAIPDKKALGLAFKKEAKAVTDALAALEAPAAEALRDALAASGSAPLTLACGAVVTLTPEQVTMEVVTKKLTGRSYTPSVIEPSFGIG
jgi:glycyl-tRNA synthetase